MADDSTAGKLTFTDGESTLLLAVMQNLTSEIQFDADAIATQLGYKDGGVVKQRWGQIKRKKLSGAVASPGSGIKKRATPKKSTPKKAQADGNADADDDEQATPTKKTPAKRARKSKAEKVKDEETKVKDEEMDDSVETTEKEDE